jgi:hypothetical protein
MAEYIHTAPALVMPAEGIAGERPTRLMQAVCTLFVLSAFLPYPGLPIGDHTGLELHNLLTLALVPFALMTGVDLRLFAAFIMLLIPPFVSAIAGATLGRIDAFNVVIAVLMNTIVCFLALLPASMFARKEYLTSILRGVGIALGIHVAAGAYQVYAFANGYFPFLPILRNPSYVPLSTKADEWVQYMRRPFGLFPEPSAMSASIGPWLVVSFALLLYPHLCPVALGKVARIAMLITTGGGIWLVIWSQSAFVGPLILALVCISLPRGMQALANFYLIRRLAFVLLAIASAWMIVVFASAQFGGRLESSKAVDPWAERRSSLEIAMAIPSRDPFDFVFGVGPGRSTLLMQEEEGIDTVFSLTIRSYAEGGLLWVFCTSVVGVLILRSIRGSSARGVGICALIVWLIGITVVTSYNMSAIYLLLGVLVTWDRIFPTTQPEPWPLGSSGADPFLREEAQQ